MCKREEPCSRQDQSKAPANTGAFSPYSLNADQRTELRRGDNDWRDRVVAEIARYQMRVSLRPSQRDFIKYAMLLVNEVDHACAPIAARSRLSFRDAAISAAMSGDHSCRRAAKRRGHFPGCQKAPTHRCQSLLSLADPVRFCGAPRALGSAMIAQNGKNRFVQL